MKLENFKKPDKITKIVLYLNKNFNQKIETFVIEKLKNNFVLTANFINKQIEFMLSKKFLKLFFSFYNLSSYIENLNLKKT